MLWHTDTDEIEHGSWFRGTLYPNRMDMSWDGEYLVYLASSSDNSKSWNGICRPPRLTTLVEWENNGSWTGSGYFDSPKRLRRNCLIRPMGIPSYAKVPHADLPFTISTFDPRDGAEDGGVLYPKLRRDGWKGVQREGKSGGLLDAIFGTSGQAKSGPWTNQPTEAHPTLSMRYLGFQVKSRPEFRAFEFALEGKPHFLAGAQWATWDCLGQLLVAQRGLIKRYTLRDLQSADPEPSFALDLDPLLAPPRSNEVGASEQGDE